MTNHALTLSLMRWIVTVDGEMWSIVEVAMDGGVLLRREWDDPQNAHAVYMSDNASNCEMPLSPGVALHRWFPGDVLAECIQARWDR